MIDLTTGTYLLPNGTGVGPGVVIDLSEISYAETRLQEISSANVHKAPELRSALGKSWGLVKDSVATVVRERGRAKNALRIARATALLQAPGSADLRDAAADLDPGVVAARDRLNEIEAFYVWIEAKATGIRDGYYDVNKATHGEFKPTSKDDAFVPQPPPQKLYAPGPEIFGVVLPDPPEESQTPPKTPTDPRRLRPPPPLR